MRQSQSDYREYAMTRNPAQIHRSVWLLTFGLVLGTFSLDVARSRAVGGETRDRTDERLGVLKAPVIATGIPGAGAVTEVGDLLTGSPLHDKSTLRALHGSWPGARADPRPGGEHFESVRSWPARTIPRRPSSRLIPTMTIWPSRPVSLAPADRPRGHAARTVLFCGRFSPRWYVPTERCTIG